MADLCLGLLVQAKTIEREPLLAQEPQTDTLARNRRYGGHTHVNRLRANALKGALSKLRRTIVERRARGSLEDNLKNVKRRLEEN